MYDAQRRISLFLYEWEFFMFPHVEHALLSE